MKTTLLAGMIALLLSSIAAAAQNTATGTGTANSSSNSGAVAVSGGSSSSVTFNTPGQQSVNSNQRLRQSGSIRTTPNAIAPGLGSAAIETCYGPGVTAGVAVTGFGISGGAGQWDAACNRRLNARTIYAMGFKQQAIAIMLNEPEVAAAFGVGPGQVAPAGYRRVQPGYASGGCRMWKGGIVGLQCLD